MLGRRVAPASTSLSLPEVHGSVPVPITGSFWRKLFAFAGPGLSGRRRLHGSRATGRPTSPAARSYGYTLLSVIMLSNLMAILLQALAARLGIASGRDLAQACRDHYSRPTTIVLWLLCEIAIAACDLAEVIGSAIALNLLFGLPLMWGVCLTSLDVLLVLYLQQLRFRYVEALVVLLILGIAGCFAVELWLAQAGPRRASLGGFMPTPEIVAQSGHALHRGRHPRRDGDAAQPVSAFVDRPDAEVSATRPRAGARRCGSRPSTRRSR